MESSLPSAELDHVLASAPGLWDELRGANVFITGGTGFYGFWLLESLLHASRKRSLSVRATLLTRDAAGFRARRPHLAAAPEVSLLAGDARDFEFPAEDFTHVVHAATEASDRLNRERPEFMKEVIVRGTRRTLEFAARRGVKKFLFASSGAVYGRQRPDLTHLAEDDPGATAPLIPPSAYAEGKREAESLCAAAAQNGLEPKIARGFAFVGPGLPLDAHFAIGNFIRDALRGGPLEIHGDGTPWRSYLYASDLAVWLWTILLKGAPNRPYNVGSERHVSVAELARMTAAVVSPRAEIRIARQPDTAAPPERYVPSTARAKTELGLRETVGLEDAIRRTADWARASSGSRP